MPSAKTITVKALAVEFALNELKHLNARLLICFTIFTTSVKFYVIMTIAICPAPFCLDQRPQLYVTKYNRNFKFNRYVMNLIIGKGYRGGLTSDCAFFLLWPTPQRVYIATVDYYLLLIDRTHFLTLNVL